MQHCLPGSVFSSRKDAQVVLEGRTSEGMLLVHDPRLGEGMVFLGQGASLEAQYSGHAMACVPPISWRSAQEAR